MTLRLIYYYNMDDKINANLLWGNDNVIGTLFEYITNKKRKISIINLCHDLWKFNEADA